MSSIVKADIRIYRKGEEKPIERYKACISVTEDNTKQGIDHFKKHQADFLRLKEKASKLGLGSFDLKLYRLVKRNGKTENYRILTRVLLKAGPRPPARDGSAARRPGGRRPTRRPGPDFPQFFCPAVNPRACRDLHLVWGRKIDDGDFDMFEFGYHFNNHLNPFRS